jgi:hypothetical protein
MVPPAQGGLCQRGEGSRTAGLDARASRAILYGMRRRPLFLTAACAAAFVAGATGAAGLVAQAVDVPAADEARCFVLDIEEPDVVFMLDGSVPGDTLVLTAEPLVGSPGAQQGARAYIGVAAWRAKEPLRPSSWHWAAVGADSVRIGVVLPLWGITWHARETAAGLDGTVTYHDDAASPSRRSAFRGRRVPCPAERQPPDRSRGTRRLDRLLQ